MASEDVSKALAEAKALVAELESYDGSTASHLSLLQRTSNVRQALEQPYDAITRWLENMSEAGSLYILIRIEALQKLVPESEGGITATELARQCNVDISVITRTMRVIVANGIAVEISPDTYAHNAKSQALLPEALGCVACVSVDFMRTWGAVPEYVKTHTREDLYDIRKSPFSFMTGHEGKTYYEVLDLDHQQRHLWNTTLQNMEKNFPILGMFPFPSLEEQIKAEPDRPFIVDVGGGRGQALRALQKECGGSFGSKLVLQDLPIVIDTLDAAELPGIEPMKYDIFTPQPVKNAHVYFMRRLLHDFYDPVCVEILRNTASAMGPDSRLIISDMLIPDRVEMNGDKTLYWLDLSLLTISGRERNLADFQNLFEQVGLELVKIYKSGMGHTAMLETRLKK
ncbi:O-methyltransferase hmp5 [Paramyrothecium foliicola]|nr:O-methyltransferase hmp5 [Paramyrothecium foliicola]